MAVFVEDMDKLFDSFNSVKCAAPGKTWHSPLCDNSPHIGHWNKTSMGINSWIFLKGGKPAFKKPTPSQNGWIIDTVAVQHMWRRLRSAVFLLS
jgi:streptogramin lyase